MLLDQKRTKRIVQVVAILTSLAFAGTIFVVMGLVFFGGGSSPERDQVNELKELVKDNPDDGDAWQQLASAHIAAGDKAEAVAAGIRSIELEPTSFRNASTLVLAFEEAGDPAGAIKVLSDFTKRNPKNTDGFLALGQTAQQAGQTDIARLAYQRFLKLEPDGTQADLVRDQLALLQGGGATVTTGG